MQISNQEIATIVALSTLVFLLAPAFLLLYISSYNRKKKDHLIEKQNLQQEYEADLLRTQLEVQEQTMKNIAADLHDNIGQLLSLTSLTLGSITVSDNKTAKKLDDSQQLVRRSIKELRQLANLLHGEKIIENGLVDAIKYEVDWLKKPGIYEVSFDNYIEEEYLITAQKALVLFRLLQEVVNNIIKHSCATKINITLNQAEGKILLSVTDNGIGFNPDEVSKTGMGLSNLLRRTKAIQGELDITSAPIEGTTIAIKVPFP